MRHSPSRRTTHAGRQGQRSSSTAGVPSRRELGGAATRHVASPRSHERDAGPRLTDPASWSRWKVVALLVVVAAVLGAIAQISGAVSWVNREARDIADPERANEALIEGLGLGQGRTFVEERLGPPLADRAISPDVLSSEIDGAETIYKIGSGYVQLFWYNSELVMFTVQSCESRLSPKFTTVDGSTIRLHETSFADLSKEPLHPFYSFPASNPPTILEGAATVNGAQGTNAQSNRLDAWGFGAACPPAGFPYVQCHADLSKTSCDPTLADVRADLSEARSTFKVNTYGQRSTLHPTELLQFGMFGGDRLITR